MDNYSSGAAAAPVPPAGAHAPIRVSWDGNPWSLTGLCLLNILLIIITVGIYWFWARTEYRRYMWQMVRLENEPLEYTGTGRELLIGYLRLFLFVLLPLIVVIGGIQLGLGPKNPLVFAVTLAVNFGLFFLYFVGIFRANRYILSRTRWRGIAFGLNGNATGYAWTALWTSVLTGFTLGWIWPWRTVALRRRLTSAMFFGSAPFRFEGGSGGLYAPFVLLWLAFISLFGSVGTIQFALIQDAQLHQQQAPTLKSFDQVPPLAFLAFAVAIPLILIALSWYEARKLNLFARATKIDGLSATLMASGGSVLWLTVSNAIIMVVSLGILRPVAQARRLRYLVRRFAFSGSADLIAVKRGLEQAGMQGAGLEAAFSIEIF